MTKPTLLVLAAGMGSRYGSLKQMDGVGPNNEAIIDYSIFDAIRAGFGRVVFVIRHSFAQEFEEVFNAERFAGKIKVDYVFQELEYLPQGFTAPADRVKPWGTNHAIMMAKDTIKEPFAAINADDFYGADSYLKVSEYLQSVEGQQDKYCMVGYKIENTLSDHGYVSRGVCGVDSDGDLASMVERTSIERKDGQIFFKEGEQYFPLPEGTVVSMNMFGFTPDYFKYSEDYFKVFLKENMQNLKSEFFIPTMVNKLIASGTSKMKVLNTSAKWFGVTYKEDKPMVIERIGRLIAEGVYPEKLWK